MGTRRRILAAVALTAATVTIGAGTGEVTALRSCYIVAGSGGYTSTRCDAYSSPEISYQQRARHTCNDPVFGGSWYQYGYWAPIHGTSVAGPCNPQLYYVTGRVVLQG